MIALLDTSEDLAKCRAELGCPVEQLLTPLTRFKRQHAWDHYAIDNGAFKSFIPRSFLSLLEREHDSRKLCRFVAVPDVVANGRRTLELFHHWQNRLSGWPLALVVQDGIEDLDIPWTNIAAIFIGGTTKFKFSSAAGDLINTANAMEKWTHAGRVNTPARFEYFESLGVHSIDGTGLSRFSWMRERIYRDAMEPNLLPRQELTPTDPVSRS